MPKWVIIIVVLVFIGMYFQQHADFDKFKASCIEVFKKDKTINTVNSARARTQQEVYQVTGEGR